MNCLRCEKLGVEIELEKYEKGQKIVIANKRPMHLGECRFGSVQEAEQDKLSITRVYRCPECGYTEIYSEFGV